MITLHQFVAVLILVLLEHAQRALYSVILNLDGMKNVLILVLLEHAQRGSVQSTQATHFIGLNPCFIGTCSKRAFFVRPYVLICYVVKFTLINVFVLIKCTCFVQNRECKGNGSF